MKKNIRENPKDYIQTLRDILEDMASNPDVKDFWIVDSGDEIIFSHNGMHALHPDFMPKVKEKLGSMNNVPRNALGGFMFRERLIQYNGYTILYGCASNGWQLIFFLNKDAYLSLTMMEMESCLRRMDKLWMGISS